MDTYTLTLRPLSAFGTPLLGDTLFGQLCWSIRNRYGNKRLNALLDGYTEGRPFAVVSNACPAGYLPRPHLPASFFAEVDAGQRKKFKKRIWLPVDAIEQPLARWLDYCEPTENTLKNGEPGHRQKNRLQAHNSIDRRTGTTGEGFAPYSMKQEWFPDGTVFECHILHDAARLSPEELLTCFTDMGEYGFGRDASIGLGKFSIEQNQQQALPAQSNSNACMTLAPCAPQGLDFDAEQSFYQLFTRFGRHGDIAVHQSGQPFKNPVLMARAGAVFTPQAATAGFIGQGLGGHGELSKTMPETVQQGYAPVIPVHLPEQLV